MVASPDSWMSAISRDRNWGCQDRETKRPGKGFFRSRTSVVPPPRRVTTLVAVIRANGRERVGGALLGVPGLIRTSVLAGALVAIGCDTDPVTGPRCVPVDVAGVWEVRWVDNGGGQIVCYDASRVWAISESGCNVTIGAEPWDPANGATGTAADGRLYAEWTWYEGCHGYRETIDATVQGDTMTGVFYRLAWQQVYPADCPGGGICSASLTGTRRAPSVRGSSPGRQR